MEGGPRQHISRELLLTLIPAPPRSAELPLRSIAVGPNVSRGGSTLRPASAPTSRTTRPPGSMAPEFLVRTRTL